MFSLLAQLGADSIALGGGGGLSLYMYYRLEKKKREDAEDEVEVLKLRNSRLRRQLRGQTKAVIPPKELARMLRADIRKIIDHHKELKGENESEKLNKTLVKAKEILKEFKDVSEGEK